jgi:futalosine hydrolase
MTCLIASATALEIGPFLDRYRDPVGTPFAGKEIDVLVTGIGLVACTYHLQRQIQIKRPDIVIQVGIAGCFDKKIQLGGVVSIAEDTIADQGVVEAGNLKTVFDMGLISSNRFPYRKGWLVNPNKELLKKAGLKKVRGISVNSISSSVKLIGLYNAHFQPIIESMEGAALHYVCLQENIPFLQLRGVSNYAGERNKGKWKMKESIFNLNNELIRVLKSL